MPRRKTVPRVAAAPQAPHISYVTLYTLQDLIVKAMDAGQADALATELAIDSDGGVHMLLDGGRWIALHALAPPPAATATIAASPHDYTTAP